MEATRDEDFCVYDEDDQNKEREHGTKVRCTAKVQSPSKQPRSEEGTQETREDTLDNDSKRIILSDVDMPILVGRQRNDAECDSDSDESFDYGENEQQRRYHTDNDSSSIDESDDDSANTMPGLQERTHDDSSSKEESACNHDHADHNPKVILKSVPRNIKLYPSMGEWNEDKNDDVDYDGDNDDPIPALRLRGGAPEVVTVTDEESNNESTAQCPPSIYPPSVPPPPPPPPQRRT